MMLLLLLFLAVAALPLGLAALVLIWLTRRQIPPVVAKTTAAVAFTVGPAYQLWRLEWFDVWRHGVPPISAITLGYAPYLVCFAVIGWVAASGALHNWSDTLS
jgi:hypothetical protein